MDKDDASFSAYFYPSGRIPKSGSLHTFFEYVPGGLEGLLNFLAMAAGEDPELAEALDLVESCLAFRRANWDHYEDRILFWERVCEQVGVSAYDFRVAVMKQVDLYSSHLSHLQSIGALPDLVKSSISAGLVSSPATFKDREAHFKHTKYIPVAPTAVINTSNNLSVGVQNNLALSSLPSFDELATKSIDAIRLEEPTPKLLLAQREDFREEGAIEANEEPQLVPLTRGGTSGVS